MEGSEPVRRTDRPTALSLTLLYFLFGTVWILLSDWSVTAVFGVSELTLQAQLVKGLLFVAGSGGFIYLLVARRDRRIRDREATIRSERSEITDLESEVEHSERLLEVILSSITETVFLTDDEGRFTYVCPNVNFIFGYSWTEVESMGTVGALLGDGFPPNGFEEHALVENIEHEITDAEGREHTVLVTVTAVSIDGGSVLYSIRDITERKAQEERFRAYVENSSDVFTVVDEAVTIEYVSPSVERILGYDPEDLVGRDAFEVIHPGDRGRVEDAFDAVTVQPTGTTRSVQYRTRRADGSWLWTESRLTSPGPSVRKKYVINTHDISDLREREGRISVLDRVLRHNLRNKLNLVLGHARQLDCTDDPATTKSIRGILEAGESLLAMSEKARRFDASLRPRDDQMVEVDLGDVIRDVVKTMRSEYPLATLRYDGPDEARVAAHEALDLTLGELVENAIVHAGRDHSTVDITLTVRESTVVVSVADDGPGLAEMERRILLHGGETPLEHGLGLGLWLVRWTVDNSGGRLDVGVEDGGGTVVEMEMPRAVT